MKKLIAFAILISMISCKKQDTKPSSTGTVPITNQYTYRFNPKTVVDTIQLSINGKSIPTDQRSFNIAEWENGLTLEKGDTLKVYASAAQNFDFAIWNAGNYPLEETINKFNAVSSGSRYNIKGFVIGSK